MLRGYWKMKAKHTDKVHHSAYVTSEIVYYKHFDELSIEQRKAFQKLSGQFSIIFSRFPSRTELNYTQDLIEVRNNLRFMLHNSEYATNQDLRQEKFGDLSVQYRDIYRAKQNLTEENYAKFVEHCFDKFREGVKQYEVDFQAKQEEEKAEKIRQRIEYKKNKLRAEIEKAKAKVKKMDPLIEENDDNILETSGKENTGPEETIAPTKWRDLVTKSVDPTHINIDMV